MVLCTIVTLNKHEIDHTDPLKETPHLMECQDFVSRIRKMNNSNPERWTTHQLVTFILVIVKLSNSCVHKQLY